MSREERWSRYNTVDFEDGKEAMGHGIWVASRG